jgi:hypothetical protein
VRKSDPLAACLSCGCLSCCLIGTVLDQQAELHGSGWSTSEVLGALAEADETGRLRLSPDFSDLAALEGHINALQDELDSIRMQARRVFQAAD